MVRGTGKSVVGGTNASQELHISSHCKRKGWTDRGRSLRGLKRAAHKAERQVWKKNIR